MSLTLLRNNVSNLCGSKGEAWFNELPTITQQLSVVWSLSNVQPVDNLSWNFVATAVKDNQLPVALKISFEQQLIDNEIKALQYFNRRGCIALIDNDPNTHSILLQQAVPGITLKSRYPQQASAVIQDYANIIQQLAGVTTPIDNNFQSVENWLSVLDTMGDGIIPAPLLNKAISLKNDLLKTDDNQYLLHGDCHLDNILQHRDKWLAIDPKGIIGEIAFEAAAFDFIHPSEYKIGNNVSKLFQQRVNLLAILLKLDPNRLSAWVFVRLILSAAWFIQDRGDPSQAIARAQYINDAIKSS